MKLKLNLKNQNILVSLTQQRKFTDGVFDNTEIWKLGSVKLISSSQMTKAMNTD